MSGTILIRGARQLLTLHGAAGPRRGPALRELSIIRDGALLVEDGRISEVGPSRRIENLARSRRVQEIDASGRVVMPGFVDCHTQLVWGVPWLDDFEASMHPPAVPPQGSDTYSKVLRSASAKRLESRARHLVNGMVRHGTTSLEANSGYGLDQRTELKVLRVQAKLDPAPVDMVSTYWSAPSIPAAQAGDPAAYLAWLCSEMLPAIKHKSLARFVGLRCTGRVFNAEQGRSYLACARSLGFRVKVHRGTYASSQAVQMALEASAQCVDDVADASVDDVERLANSETMAVLLPGSTFTFRNRDDVPARELIDGGAAIALGTDFTPGTSPTYSMQTIVALACGSLGMTAAEAICAATYNSAHAIGSANVAGSLEVGKPADLIVLDAADYREIPYHFGVNLVHCIVKRGVTIYQEGKVALR